MLEPSKSSSSLLMRSSFLPVLLSPLSFSFSFNTAFVNAYSCSLEGLISSEELTSGGGVAYSIIRFFVFIALEIRLYSFSVSTIALLWYECAVRPRQRFDFATAVDLMNYPTWHMERSPAVLTSKSRLTLKTHLHLSCR